MFCHHVFIVPPGRTRDSERALLAFLTIHGESREISVSSWVFGASVLIVAAPPGVTGQIAAAGCFRDGHGTPIVLAVCTPGRE
jgi:hypothetical protein